MTTPQTTPVSIELDTPDSTERLDARPPSAEQVIAVLQQQRDQYEQLRALGAEQARLVESDSVDELLGLLAKRQNHIEALRKLSAQLEPIRSRLRELWPRFPLSQQRQISELLDQTQALVKGILEEDGRDRTVLEQSRSRIGNSLRDLSHAGRAVQAYGPVAQGGASPQTAPRFTDRRG